MRADLRYTFCRTTLIFAAWSIANCSAAIDFIVSRVTGEISMVNPAASSAAIVGYSINSESGSLLAGNWLSIFDNYDANDGGLIDPNDNWTPISSMASSLAEGEFVGDGGSLDPGQVVSLGLAWDPFRLQDLEILIIQDNGESTPITPTYESFAADFDSDLRVDRKDLPLWRVCFLSGCTSLGDADKDGIVNGRDYLIWLSQAGSEGPIPPPGSVGPGAAAGAGFASTSIPEPASVVLLACGCVALIVCCYRKR